MNDIYIVGFILFIVLEIEEAMIRRAAIKKRKKEIESRRVKIPLRPFFTPKS